MRKINPQTLCHFFCLTLALFCAPQAAAKIVEEVIDLPVEVKDMYGHTFKQTIKVTLFFENTKSSLSPFIVLNHGRSAYDAGRAKMGRARYTEQAKYFVSKGFVVLVPTRVGYGVSGGEDVEYSGKCEFRDYPPAYEAAAQQTLRVIEYAKTLVYVNPKIGIVIGQSFGGATAIAIAAKNPPEILAAINFAGGGGGNPDTRPQNPCSESMLKKLFANYGITARIPTLWLYSENDKYFGTGKPHDWFNAFTENGGKGKFVRLPPLPAELGPDGHATFTRNPSVWRPHVEEFIRSLSTN
jgi:dienelactone hydrolase